MDVELREGGVVEHLVDLGDQTDVEVEPRVTEQLAGNDDLGAIAPRLEPRRRVGIVGGL